MAIFYLECKTGNRKNGYSAVQETAKRRGIELYERKTGQCFNYVDRKGIVYNNFVIPDNPPEWLIKYAEGINNNSHEAIEKYWNYMESCENRRDARIDRTFNIALPIELSLDQHISLSNSFVKNELAAKGMVVDYSIRQIDGNPNLDIAVSMRKIETNGFGQKVSEWDNRKFLIAIRSAWANHTNRYLKLAGHSTKIDHRSFEENQLGLLPSLKIGHTAQEMAKRGELSDRIKQAEEIRLENIKLINDNPALIYKKILLRKSTFTVKDVLSEIIFYSKSVLLNMSQAKKNEIISEEGLKEINRYLQLDDEKFIYSKFQEILKKNIRTEKVDFFIKILYFLRKSKEISFIHVEDGYNFYSTIKSH